MLIQPIITKFMDFVNGAHRLNMVKFQRNRTKQISIILFLSSQQRCAYVIVGVKLILLFL